MLVCVREDGPGFQPFVYFSVADPGRRSFLALTWAGMGRAVGPSLSRSIAALYCGALLRRSIGRLGKRSGLHLVLLLVKRREPHVGGVHLIHERSDEAEIHQGHFHPLCGGDFVKTHFLFRAFAEKRHQARERHEQQ